MLFNNYKIFICAGIGSQLLRLLAGVGKAISENVQPQKITIIFTPYPNTSNYISRDYVYHNSEEVPSYVNTSKLKYKIQENTDKSIHFNFDEEMLSYIKTSLTGRRFSNYFEILEEGNEKSHHENMLWVRGRDRINNAEKFDKIAAKLKENKSEFTVSSNDTELIRKFKNLNSNFDKRTSAEDFKALANSKNIYTQISGFSIAPFLLSSKDQNLYLLDKSLHDRSQYHHLDKDWDFFIDLLEWSAQNIPEKTFSILK